MWQQVILCNCVHAGNGLIQECSNSLGSIRHPQHDLSIDSVHQLPLLCEVRLQARDQTSLGHANIHRLFDIHPCSTSPVCVMCTPVSPSLSRVCHAQDHAGACERGEQGVHDQRLPTRRQLPPERKVRPACQRVLQLDRGEPGHAGSPSHRGHIHPPGERETHMCLSQPQFSVGGSVYRGLCTVAQSRSQHASSTHLFTRVLRTTQASHS